MSSSTKFTTVKKTVERKLLLNLLFLDFKASIFMIWIDSDFKKEKLKMSCQALRDKKIRF